jgi:alpha-1,2-mannosyltransferase
MTAVLNAPASSTARSRWLPRAAWAVLSLAAVFGAWRLVGAWSEGMSSGHDFVQDYAAIVKIAAGRNPYEPYNDVTQQLFGGPPHRGKLYSFHAPSSLPFFLWLLPFHWAAGYPGAFVAWGVASLLGLWAVCWLTLRVLGAPRPALAGALGALALVSLPPIRENFEEGQLNVLVMAGVVGCWAAQRAGRSALGGVLLAAAFALKPIPGLFFLYYLWRRDWRLLASAAVTLGVLSVIGVALSGIDGAWLWATVNYPDHAAVWPGYPDNASVRGFFTRIFGPSEWRPRPRYPLPYAAMAFTLASGVALALLAWLAARRPASLPHRPDLEVAALSLLTLLVTPIVWPHYYVVLVMPVALVATTLVRLLRPPATLAMATSEKAPIGRAGRAMSWPVAAALVALAGACALLATAHYVEPFRGVGGQQLAALLAVFAVSLLTLRWSRSAGAVSESS